MRAGCRYFRLHRSTYAYRGQASGCLANETKSGSKAVITAIREVGLSQDHEAVEGTKAGRWVNGSCNVCDVNWVWRSPHASQDAGAGVSPPGLPTKAEHPDHVWTWDFIHDKTVRGGSLKMLTVLDEYTRECRVIHVDRHINAETVRGIMQKLLDRHGSPKYIRSDNGSEFIESQLRAWLTAMKIKNPLYRTSKPLAERIH